jgi:hypothetical protein
MKSVQKCFIKIIPLFILITWIACSRFVFAESLVKVADMSLEKLQNMVSNGRELLSKITSSPAESASVEPEQAGEISRVDSELDALKQVVMAAAERARRLAEWDLSEIEKDAEQTFDTTINAIEEYLVLVSEDGLVHQAKNKIRTAALEQARIFREKAAAKAASQKTSSKRYAELADNMKAQALKTDSIWNSIKAEREAAVNGLKALKESRELYIDVKKAQGIEAAVRELENVRNDLAKLSASMATVRDAIQNVK